MKINGILYKTYLLDNIFTVKRRYAYLNKVIPDYIFFKEIKEESSGTIEFEKIETYNKNKNYEIINLESKILESDINKISKVYAVNLKYFSLSLIDFACLWCRIKYKNKIPSVNNSDFYQFIDFVEKQNVKIDYIEENIPYFLKKLDEKLKKNSEEVTNELKILEYFERLEIIKSTDLEIIKIKKEYIYTTNVDSCHFFDSIKLSNDIPFAILKDFYKVCKDFKPLIKWVFISDEYKDKETIILKVSTKRDTKIFNKIDNNEDIENDMKEKKILEEDNKQ